MIYSNQRFVANLLNIFLKNICGLQIKDFEDKIVDLKDCEMKDEQSTNDKSS